MRAAIAVGFILHQHEEFVRGRLDRRSPICGSDVLATVQARPSWSSDLELGLAADLYHRLAARHGTG